MQTILDIATIYSEPDIETYPRAREILAKFPDAERIEVASHWKIPHLHGNAGESENWLRNKREILVLGARKSLNFRPNGRSADFIAPGASNGCALACSYCYVPRRKGFANPITTFVNIEQMCAALEKHALKQGMKLEENSVDADLWVYEIGENGDCSVDAAICDNVRDLVETAKRLPNAKITWATKWVNRDLLSYNPQKRTRIRFSLMPAHVAKVVDVRTSPMAERIAAINDFVEAGYEVHLNFSPVIIRDNWLEDYAELLRQLRDELSNQAKQQLACEIIFLTHSQRLHEVNVQWHPRAEELLWTPFNQELKTGENGDSISRYRHGYKGAQVRALSDLIDEILPECRVRYAF
ncbi:MAG TPA: spore photoproduct lyase family protein [Abditibacteriaceae bacterium]|jgi:spore photoproduct lyase family protein